jgi:tetratricopeptide (TPR) repeat protein
MSLFRSSAAGVLVFLMCGYAQMAFSQAQYVTSSQKIEAPLHGESSVTNLEVHKNKDDRWIVSFDYFYNGVEGGPRAFLYINWAIDTQPKTPLSEPRGEGLVVVALFGAHHVNVEMPRPLYSGVITTKLVVANLVQGLSPNQKTLFTQTISKEVAWPDAETYLIDEEIKSRTVDQVMQHAVELIDQSSSTALFDAKRLLERLLLRNPRVDSAYIELARIAMKSNWGPEGLHQAEVLLSSALQIQAGSPNALILKGYVYTHQGRFKDAENLFRVASKGNPENLWLWTNWGELFEKQGSIDAAISKYRVATDHAPTGNTYDRARIDAFARLISLLEKKKDLDGLDALYKARVTDYGGSGCYGAAYALFKVQKRGDAMAAIALAKESTQSTCSEADGRGTLGLAYYLAWATNGGPDQSDFLNQARIYYPAGAALLYELAKSEHTLKAAKKLIDTGESIDQIDNRKLNALSYALNDRAYDSVKRLLRLGARPEKTVGAAAFPVALIPIFANDYEGIRLMTQNGVEYSKMSFQGMNIMEYAKRMGDKKLIDALNFKGPST